MFLLIILLLSLHSALCTLSYLRHKVDHKLIKQLSLCVPDSSVGIATRYALDGPEIES